MLNKLRSLYKAEASEAPKLLSVLTDQVFMSIATLLTTIILARTFDKIVYADLVLLFSITLFILGFQSAVISKPYAINLNDFSNEEKRAYFHFNITFKLIFTLGIAALFPLLYYLLFDGLNIPTLLHFLLFIISYTFYFFVRETLLSERKTRENLFYGLACSISLIALLLGIFFYDITSLHFYLKFSSFIYLILTGIYLFRNFKRREVFSKKNFPFFLSNWEVGKWLLGSNFLFHLSANVYPWLLLFLTTKNDIAILGVLMSVGSVIKPVLTAFNAYLLPVFVRLNTNYKKIRRLVRKWAMCFGIIALVLIGTGYFFGADIVNLLFGEKYAGLGILVIYPFIVQAIHLLFEPFKIALEAIKRTDVNFWILIPRSFIAIGLGFFLISRYGLAGAFYTMIIESLFYRVLHFILYLRIIRNNKSLLAPAE